MKIISKIRSKQPLVHCITNPISITQCANAVLALGGKPIMAEHPYEVEEITMTADALLLNLGNVTDPRMESMFISAAAARSRNTPVVIDLVGVACSSLRRSFAHRLLEERAALIKGNYSELYAMYSSEYKFRGVDSEKGLSEKDTEKIVLSLARKYSCTVLASGQTDIVSDGARIIRIYNGTPRLGTVTGTGCILGAIAACCLSVMPGIYAAADACAILGICGEGAASEKGSGSFFVKLMDSLSSVTEEDLKKNLKMEEVHNEEI